MRASITGWTGRLQASEANLSLRDFAGVWSGRRVDGADIDAAATDEFSQMKASASKGTVTAIGNVFEEIAGAVTFDKQNVTIERLAMKWGGSRVRLRARLTRKTAPTPNQVELSGSVDKIDWDAGARLWADIRAAISTRTAAADGAEERPWLRTFKYSIPRGFPDTIGHVRVGEVSHPNFKCKDADLLWSIRGVTPALDKVSGEARLSLRPRPRQRYPGGPGREPVPARRLPSVHLHAQDEQAFGLQHRDRVPEVARVPPHRRGVRRVEGRGDDALFPRRQRPARRLRPGRRRLRP